MKSISFLPLTKQRPLRRKAGPGMVAKFNFEVRRGIAKTLPLSFIACRLPCGYEGCGRGPLRLRGFSLALEIIKGGLSSEVVDTLTTEDGRLKVDTAENVLFAVFSPETIAKYPRYAMPYRITATYEKGTSLEKTYVLLFGEIKIRG